MTRSEWTRFGHADGMDLTGHAVIVTGSSSGIGAAIARRLDALGAGVVVNSATSVEAGKAVAAELRDAVYVQGDIGDPATATRSSTRRSRGGGGSTGWSTTPR